MDNSAQKFAQVLASDFTQEFVSIVEQTRLNWESGFQTSRPAPDAIYFVDTEIWFTWCKFLGQTLVETNNIQKILSGRRKRMARRIKPPRPDGLPIVVPADFERDGDDRKTRINYMMKIRLEGGKGALVDTYHRLPRYDSVETLFALQRLRNKFPEFVLGEVEKDFFRKMLGSEPH